MWGTWRPKFGWQSLCPVLFSDPIGLVVVMPWATRDVTHEEVDLADDRDCHPATDAEQKPESFGKIKGRVLAFDYGLPDVDSVRDRRTYYKSFR